MYLRKYCMLLFAVVLMQLASAQTEILFQDKPFAELQQASAKQEKLIFIDCYTSWCGPCKWMEKNVFVLPEVAAYYNSNFINAKFDMEKGEGIDLKRKYAVSYYPTYLFVNAAGEVIHRSGSRMEAEKFIEVAQMANDPKRNSVAVKKQYLEGRSDFPFLLDCYAAMSTYDPKLADKIAEDLRKDFPDSELNTEMGWNMIKTFVKSEDDRFGKHFMKNPSVYLKYAGEQEVEALKDRLISISLYSEIRAGNESAFRERLKYFKDSEDVDKQVKGVVIESGYYLEKNEIDAFNELALRALNGMLKNNAEQLSYIARRADMRGTGNPEALPVAYLLAKRAVELSPDEYSIQSTFAQICLSMKKKNEGLIAAKKALTMAETTKIEAIVQKLISNLEML